MVVGSSTWRRWDMVVGSSTWRWWDMVVGSSTWRRRDMVVESSTWREWDVVARSRITSIRIGINRRWMLWWMLWWMLFERLCVWLWRRCAAPLLLGSPALAITLRMVLVLLMMLRLNSPTMSLAFWVLCNLRWLLL